MDGQEIITGGVGNEHGQIAPTILDNVHPDSPVMQEEIFGPILPLLTYHDIEDVITWIRSRPKPLALYLFSNCKTTQNEFYKVYLLAEAVSTTPLCTKASHHLPFGASVKAVWAVITENNLFYIQSPKKYFKKSNRLDIPIRYAPYTSFKETLLKTFL